MAMITKIQERYRTRGLIGPVATGTAAQAYLRPTPTAKGITVRCVANMGNAAELVLTLNYANDAAGAGAAAWPVDVPIYKNNVRQPDGKAFTITDDTGIQVVDFVLDAANVPDGKFLGLSFAASNAANLLAVTLIEDVAYHPYKE
ncbi:hypothetical protein P4H70_23020 [Paenibacillus ehimensis]|uniref:hypothetical protein n=1 Tax=Paenibacillus ehimensis TaxID=79264 RepID=UPI002DB96381|nr:hypothetical protein [Paenibacillus ehimensis]MEC0211817.1 hypothetical protein [Paenibacillus ehimensis]